MAASRRASVAPFFAMEILKAATERAAQGARVYHMETGEPGSGAPEGLLTAARAALAGTKIGYTEADGVLPLRERIAAFYGERYGFAPPVERIVVTTGGSAGIILAFLAAFDVGDRVALEPHLSCGRCALCLGGAYHNCRSLMPPGAPPCYGYTPRDVGHGLWGGYSEYIHLHERTMLHRVPETMPLALALLYQPIAAGIRWAVHVPATAMGDTMRRYWLPALLAQEIAEPDGPPVRVRLLGESLVAFRDSDGRVGVLEELCAHRRASLFLGRNEEGGLRCVYHGWKYDVEGRLLDRPTEPPHRQLRDRIRVLEGK